MGDANSAGFTALAIGVRWSTDGWFTSLRVRCARPERTIASTCEDDVESQLVESQTRGHITIITLHRRDKRNAFDPNLPFALDPALDSFEDDPDQWVAVLTGGPDMFSAGSDLKEGSGKSHRGGEYGIIRRQRLQPIIAAAEG